MSSTPAVTIRLYTRARKIPFLLGKLGDWQIWGGPYTLTQMVTAVAAAYIGKLTMRFWAGDMPAFMAWAVVLVVAGGCGLVAGRIPMKGRNPLIVLQGIFGYVDAPAWGTQGGKDVALRRTRRLRHRESLPTTMTCPLPPAEGEPALEPEQEPVELEDLEQFKSSHEEQPAQQPPIEGDKPLTAHQLDEVQRILAASAQRR